MGDQIDRLQAALAGRYTVERELGAGGMATVYLARDAKHNRDVALKVLRPELMASGYRPERFLREIQTLAALTHPNILPLYDSEERDGVLYYVMPYMGGGSLRDRLRREGMVSIDETVAISRAVASALDYAHRQDVLHRDIKPENILFSEGQPVVADFGIARAISACCDGVPGLTEAGIAVGTPAYMSPEQAAADGALDARSDIYSLGCVVYEMLTGRPPFPDAGALKTMAKHATEPVPPLRPRRPNCPATIEQAVLRALAKQPEERFARALEFADALTDRAAGRTDVASLVDARRTIAVLPFVNASPDPDNEYLSDGISDALIHALTQVDGLHVASRTSVFALKGEGHDARAIGARLNVSAIIEGSVRQAGQRVRVTVALVDASAENTLWSERYDRQLDDVVAIQDDIATTIVRTLRATLLRDLGEPVARRYTENAVAYRLYLRGRYYWNLRTPDALAAAVEQFERAVQEDPDYALAYTGLADCYALQTDYRGIPVTQGMERAKAEARRALSLDDTLAEAHTSLGWVTFIYDWDWALAEREFRRAIALNPRYSTARQWHAWLLMAMGHIEESVAEGSAALTLDPASVSVCRTLGWLYLYANDTEHSIEHLQRAVRMDPTSWENHRLLGLALAAHGSLDDALIAAEEAVAGSGRSAYSLATLGHIRALRGEKDLARALLRDLSKQAELQYVSPVALVVLHSALGEYEGALDWLEQAHQERRGWLCYLRVEPLLSPLRGHERFQRLLNEMRLV
jgi:serine/threonine protein kinase/Flp pilus assembly protein TadD